MSSAKFTVFYDGQFWVGVLEIVEDGELRTARHLFGSEPTGPELYEFSLHEYGALSDLAHRSPAVPASQRQSLTRLINPKRMARQVAMERARPATSTAAQLAHKLMMAENTRDRKASGKRLREAAARTHRELARIKAKARHRGKA